MQEQEVLLQTIFLKKEATVIPLVIWAELVLLTMVVYEPRFSNC